MIFTVRYVVPPCLRAARYGFDVTQMGSINWREIKDKRDAYVRRLNAIYDGQ